VFVVQDTQLITLQSLTNLLTTERVLLRLNNRRYYMNRLTRIFATAALSTAFAFAQGAGDGTRHAPDPQKMTEMRVNMLTARLGLSESQKSQATAIFTQAATDGQAIRTSMQPIYQSLSDAVKKNDTAGIDQFSADLGSLTGKLTAIDRKADAALYAILTPEQQTKYSERGQGGPGGFGPGRGGFRGGR
jgi:Spy/CpxP family protein refolding chaperone